MPPQTFLRILRVRLPTNNHDLAALRHGFLDELASLSSRRHVVRTDVANALAVGGIAVGNDQQRLAGNFVQKIRLVVGINRADGYAINAGGNEIVQNLLLFGGAAGPAECENPRPLRPVPSPRHCSRHGRMVQKFAALLLTKASFNFLAGGTRRRRRKWPGFPFFRNQEPAPTSTGPESRNRAFFILGLDVRLESWL